MRGGKRPGAGAPRGNMNAMKHGGYSRQGVYPERCASSSRRAEVGALLASDPTIREALLALGRKHNVKQQRANEVAALLFTRLFQRAEKASAGRLNLELPAHESDSIKLAAGLAAARQIRSALRRADKNEIQPASIKPQIQPDGDNRR